MNKSKWYYLTGLILCCLGAMPLPALAADIQADLPKETFPPLEQAQSEISKLNDNISAIEARYEKELSAAGEPINQRYSEKLDALKNEQPNKFESPADFKARQDQVRDELISQQNIELVKLDSTKAKEAEIAPLKARVKALTEHRYIVGSEGIEAVLSAYDADKQQFSIKLRSKFSALSLSLNGTIPLQHEEADLFNKLWQAGLVKPEAAANLNGDWVELALVDDKDNTRWVELKKMFFSLGKLKTLSSATLNDLFQPGRRIKDCPSCPDMVVIPAGSFDMGSNDGAGDEKPVHSVTIAQPFAMGKTEITQGEWKAVMGNAPGNFKNCGDSCPVEQVSWNDAQVFIQKLNAKTGKQYRLPSEAEWEYACRAGGLLDYCGSGIADEVAWYSKNSGGFPHATAQKKANAWGLYDMNGNVWEWVEDSYHADYNGAPIDGTAWQGEEAERVLRGGAWNLIADLVRASTRSAGAPILRDYYYGFRIVRMLP